MMIEWLNAFQYTASIVKDHIITISQDRYAKSVEVIGTLLVMLSRIEFIMNLSIQFYTLFDFMAIEI